MPNRVNIDWDTLTAEQLRNLYSRLPLDIRRRLFCGMMQNALNAKKIQKIDSPLDFIEKVRATLPEKLHCLFDPSPVKIIRGGRGSAKSTSVGRVLVALAYIQRERILCTREFQTSIKDSVHQVLKRQIEILGLTSQFEVTEREIRCTKTGSEFIFKGIRRDPDSLKSVEGITKTWVEEGQLITRDSLDILLPTIFRDENDRSQLIVTYNPELEDSPIEELVKFPIADSIIRDVNWRDNPYFPQGLERLRSRAEKLAEDTGDWSAYDWIWEGKYRLLSEAVIFGKRVVFEEFETPITAYFYHGVDWGFSVDPTVLIRCYITDEDDGRHLWIDKESYGYETPIDEYPCLFSRIETSRRWPIKADSSRPETIHHVSRMNYNITAAKKWSGSVEDGIEFLKGFKKIHIHLSCTHMIEEAKLYSYKQDPITRKIFPIPVDAHNHGWDAVRYALDDLIRNNEPLRIPSDVLAKSRRGAMRYVKSY